jgi:hypothetical protein
LPLLCAHAVRFVDRCLTGSCVLATVVPACLLIPLTAWFVNAAGRRIWTLPRLPAVLLLTRSGAHYLTYLPASPYLFSSVPAVICSYHCITVIRVTVALLLVAGHSPGRLLRLRCRTTPHDLLV